MTGWTVTVWVDAPDDWGAERVREEVDELLGDSTHESDGSPLVLNAVYTPKAEDAGDA